MVVYFHVQCMLSECGLGAFASNAGAAGVEVFFVISGFVMFYSWYDKFQLKNSTWSFIYRRLKRILPAYYLFTTIAVLILVFLPKLYGELRFTLDHTVFSYLLILSDNNTGKPGTVVGVGWTLVYEGYFYLLFSILLNFSRKLLIPCLTMIFLAGLLFRQFFGTPFSALIVGTNPILFVFLLGCILGYLVKKGFALNKYIAVLSIVCGAIWIYNSGNAQVVGGEFDPSRLFAFGIPSFLIVAGGVSLEKEIKMRRLKGILLLGDSSYSLYLSHQFVLEAIGIILLPVLIALRVQYAMIFLLCMFITAGCGVICYIVYERPLDSFLSKMTCLRKNQGVASCC